METKKLLANAVCTALVAGVATKFIFGEYDTVRYYGIQMSAPIANGLGCGCGSIVSDLTSELVIKKFGLSNQLVNGSTLAVKAGVCGGASSAVLYFGGLPSSAIIPAFVLGSGSKLGGDYVYDKVLDPKTGFMPLF